MQRRSPIELKETKVQVALVDSTEHLVETEIFKAPYRELLAQHSVVTLSRIALPVSYDTK